MGIGFVTHLLASFILLAFVLWQIIRRKSGLFNTLFIWATIFTLAWTVAISFQNFIPVNSTLIVFILEALKSTAWVVLLLHLLGFSYLFKKDNMDQDSRTGLTIFSFAALIPPVFTILYLCSLFIINTDNQAFALNPSYIIAGFLLTSIVVLALLEQVVRNSRAQRAWNMKFLCIGLGLAYCFDLYIYSDALLFGQLNPNFFEALGIIISIAFPLLSISYNRTKKGQVQVSISRRFVFHSSVIFAAGVYLILMAFAGYYIRNVSGEWGVILQVVFWITSLGILIVMASSGKVRSNLKAYINENLFASKYDYREEWLKLSNTLYFSDSGMSLPERSILAIGEIIDCHGGGLWLMNDDYEYTQVAEVELGWVANSNIPKDHSFIAYLQSTTSMMDLRHEHKLSENTLPEWLIPLNKIALVVPLLLQEKLYGFLLLGYARTDFELNWEDSDILKTAGQQAASYLAQMMASEELMKAKQFTAFSQMSAFVVHDLKTLNSQLSLMVSNAERHKTNPSFIDDMIDTTQHAVEKMDSLLQHFKKNEDDGPNADAKLNKKVDLVEVIESLVEKQQKLSPKPVFETSEQNAQISATSEEVYSSLGHIIQNAQEATSNEGRVEVTLESDQENYRIIISDSGKGMSQEFINTKLFQPFVSTKGLSGMGIGVYQCREFIRNLGGEISVVSAIDKGTTFTVKIPKIPES